MANTASSTLITKCLDNASRAATGTTRSGTALSTKGLDWLNSVLQYMSRVHDFREMYNLSSGTAGISVTVASTKNYTFPTDWKVILSVRILDGTNSRKLSLINIGKFDRALPRPENETERRPLFYMPLGNTFDLFPIPDAVYTMPIRYIKRPAVITSTATLIDYEPARDELIVSGMSAEMFDFLQLYTDAEIHRNKFKQMLKQAVVDDGYQPDWHPSGDGFDSGYDKVVLGEYYNDPFVRYNP